jgi:predicted nucleic acid-binding protein
MELAARGKITGVQLRTLLSGIAAYVAQARIAVPRKRLVICRDPEDNMVLECCSAARADFLITGDRDLLEMDKTVIRTHIPGLKILSPRAFLGQRKRSKIGP